MEDFLNWLAAGVFGRIDGPLHFRLFMQPIMAAVLAVRDGRKDARMGRQPYFWSLFTEPEERMKRIKEGWKAISRVFFLAVALDLIYQFIVFSDWRIFRAGIVAFVLAILPYLLIRGPVSRVMAAARREHKNE